MIADSSDELSDYEDETEKTTKEAKLLLEALKQTEEIESEDENKKQTKIEKKIINSIQFDQLTNIIIYRLHKLSPVCISISNDNQYVVSCSKDGATIKYDIRRQKKCGVLQLNKNNSFVYHKGKVTCCAISPNDKYLVTGGEDCLIKIWDFQTLEHVKDLDGHLGAITSLTFRKILETIELFSASADRSIKAWNLDQMGFIDTMYGHLYAVAQIDMLVRPKVLACGGMDRTVRLFKIAEESQLVFNGFFDCISIETVAMIDDEHFVSGALDGSINVWSITKKKPVCTVKQAHGTIKSVVGLKPYWICSVASYPYSNIIASGSYNGYVILWKVSVDYKSLTKIDEFQLCGFINDIRFTNDCTKIICAVGQEHKDGRWVRIKDAQNSVVVIPLNKK